MSSVDPFELEGRTQFDPRPTFELTDAPKKTSWTGDALRSPYTILEGLGAGAAKGEALLGGLTNVAGRAFSTTGTSGPVDKELGGMLERTGDSLQQDARSRVKAMTPDATTTGAATRVLHAVSSGIEEYTLGALAGGAPGAAAVIGGSEGVNRDLELQEQGVDRTTAAESGALTGAASAAGALLPAAYGSTLLTRLLTGAGSNVAMGAASRYGDHLILEANGYPEMAEQQKALDVSQILVDAALGATFGGLHHLGADPEKRDAALTQNLANADRRSSPGVPTDPNAANAHQAALETATESLVKGEPVDVSHAGLDDSAFLQRPAPNISEPQRIMIDAFKEAGYFDADSDIRSLEKALRERGQQVESESETVPRGTDQADINQVLAPEVPEDHVRYYHGGAPTDDHSGPLWFTSSVHDAEGWASRSKGMKVWYVDVPKDHPARGEGDLENGIPLPSRVELPADLASKRSPLRPVLDEPLKERPDLQIPDENGNVVRAADALEQAKPEENMGDAVKAAVNCFSRRGG